jgi:hypothetical protein
LKQGRESKDVEKQQTKQSLYKQARAIMAAAAAQEEYACLNSAKRKRLRKRNKQHQAAETAEDSRQECLGAVCAQACLYVCCKDERWFTSDLDTNEIFSMDV